MSISLRVHEVFRLADGSTVIACDRPSGSVSWNHRKGRLVLDGRLRQEIVFTGERKMLRQSANFDKIALETRDAVDSNPDDVAAGRLELVF